MTEGTKYIKFTDSFQLSIEDAMSLLCHSRACNDRCPLWDVRCCDLADPPIDADDKMCKLTSIAKLEHWVHTHYCANAGTEYAETDQFVCSECGLHLQDWIHIVDTDDTEDSTLSEYTFKYCPNCGRKIYMNYDKILLR